ncbi:SDR family NAD(P)-dependent oxidoreductase [Cupriavidus sp. RAF12]|uniref:SDR family NAD(P)-dependent oxidoreductase n=1 Tax=Cupriavidus sp. RAF12 TaxID=3233050 RepID=UPI003F92E030
MSKKRALVTGVGPGTGLAVVNRLLAGGYQVAMISRSAERLKQWEAVLPGTRAFVADVSDPQGFDVALDSLFHEFGAPELVVHNAVGGAFGNFMQVDPAVLQRNFQTNVMAFLHLARRVAPAMIEAGHGVILATGNTSALRGKSHFAAFAPTKAAQRILAESIARELGPQGVHVAYLVIDAVIDLEWTRKMRPDAPDDFFIKPADIAEEIWHLAHQPKGAWSFNAEIRPFRESW